MNDSTAKARFALALLSLEGIGRSTAIEVMRSAPSVPVTGEELHEAVIRFAGRRGARLSRSHADLAFLMADESLSHALRHDVHVIPYSAPEFPQLLARIKDPPAVLYVRGPAANVARLDSIAIIGTREPTLFGESAAARVAQRCAEFGLVVVSGLALGCDAQAHEGSLLGHGVTVAVLAHGLDTVQPAANRALAHRILDSGGSWVSEYPVGEPARRTYFVERDRIQSGLSQAVVVIETDIKGGSMHTARFAREQGRVLAAIKHPAHLGDSPKSQGNQALMRDNDAVPLGDADDLSTLITRVKELAGTCRSSPGNEPAPTTQQLDLWS